MTTSCPTEIVKTALLKMVHLLLDWAVWIASKITITLHIYVSHRSFDCDLKTWHRESVAAAALLKHLQGNIKTQQKKKTTEKIVWNGLKVISQIDMNESERHKHLIKMCRAGNRIVRQN